ncbi:MAG TPA: hypothetical protein VM840_10960 [Actinomycetota bacterium]|nr:hypothetical protein [Actinomycetota bacterium]
MARDISVNCEICGTTLPLERAKEVLFERDQNSYHVMDLCPTCLDDVLQRSESVNDTNGMRQQAAALVRMPGNEIPAGASSGAQKGS